MADRDAGGEVETLEGPQAPGSNGRERLRFDRLFVLATVLVLAGLVGGWMLLRGGGPAPSPGGAASPGASTGSPAAGEPDFEAIVREIYAARTRAIVEGRPGLVDEFYSEQCSCNADLKKRIQEGGVVQQGQRLVGYAPKVLKVEVVHRLTPALVSLRVVDEQAPFITREASGQELRSPGWVPTSRTLDLALDPDGRWRAVFLLTEGEADKVLGPGWRAPSTKG